MSLAPKFVKLDMPWRIGCDNGSNFIEIAQNGTPTFHGSAKGYEDSQVPPITTRVGAVAPTTDNDFRGDGNYKSVNFVHTQADEVQFQIQLPHSYDGRFLYPHVHFSTYTALGAGTYAAQFILEYYVAPINDQFPATPATYTMTKTWTAEKRYYHFIAAGTAPLDATLWGLSTILYCRLYRDNGVANNFGGKVTLLGFDIHYVIDSIGSRQEYIK